MGVCWTGHSCTKGYCILRTICILHLSAVFKD